MNLVKFNEYPGAPETFLLATRYYFSEDEDLVAFYAKYPHASSFVDLAVKPSTHDEGIGTMFAKPVCLSHKVPQGHVGFVTD